MSALRQQGITALKTGNKSQARQLFRMAIDENPQDAQAWLWLSGAVETDQERLACLKTVLRIDPENQLAARGIAKLVASGNLDIQDKLLETTPPPQAPALVQRTEGSRASVDRTPRVLFETRPSFVPFILVPGLLLLTHVTH